MQMCKYQLYYNLPHKSKMMFAFHFPATYGEKKIPKSEIVAPWIIATATNKLREIFANPQHPVPRPRPVNTYSRT